MRSSLLAGLALAATLPALDPVLVGGRWWLAPLVVVVLVALVGGVCRRLRAPGLLRAGLTLAAGALGVAATTGVVTPDQVREQVAAAWQYVQVSGAPAAVTAELGLVLTLTFALLAWVVDLVAERFPALVALPMLAVVVTGSTFTLFALPATSIAVPAAAYVLLLLLGGRGRERAGATSTGGALAVGALAVAGAVLVAGSATSISTEGRLDRGGSSLGLAGPSPFTGLAGDLRRGDPVDLLRLTGVPNRAYIRTMALQEWTNGVGWSLGDRLADEVPSTGPRGQITTVEVETLAYRGPYLPVPEGTFAVERSDVSWRYDDARDAWHRGDASDPGDYTLLVDGFWPWPDDLVDDTVDDAGDVEVPGLDPRVRDLALEVTAGAETPYAKALALQEWFTDGTNGFTYSLSVPEGNSGDLLVDFLESRVGYCEQYASAMAVMLRSVGVPARVAIGFGPGRLGEDGVTSVTTENAHAWVEVDFDRTGWVRFEPTPGGAPATGETGPTGGAPVLPTPDPGEPDPTPGEALPDDALTPGAPGATPGDPGTTPTGAPAPGASEEIDTPPLDLGRGELVLALALAVAFLPRVWRWARRRRRMLAVRRGGPRGAAAAWAEIEALAVDHGVPVRASESVRTVATRIADDAHLSRDARADLDAVVTASERAWFAPDPRSRGGSAQSRGGSARSAARRAVAQVRTGLDRHQLPGLVRWWFPPSLLRDTGLRAEGSGNGGEAEQDGRRELVGAGRE